MVNGIKQIYRTLSDASIIGIEYGIIKHEESTKFISINIICFNWQTENWDNLKLIFNNVTFFRFIEGNETQSTIIFEALIKVDSEQIIVDFFPIQVDGLGILAEDPNSSFAIKCTELTYEVLK